MEMHKGHTFERAVEKTVLHSTSFLLKQIQQPPTCLVQRCVYPHTFTDAEYSVTCNLGTHMKFLAADSVVAVL